MNNTLPRLQIQVDGNNSHKAMADILPFILDCLSEDGMEME